MDDTLKYIIMRKNEPITYAEFTTSGDMITYSKNMLNKELAPLQDAYQNDWLKRWWNERSIPVEQDNILNFLRQNGYSMPNDYLIKNLGLSLTDYYWLKPLDSDLTWEDVNLYDNDFKGNLLTWDSERDNEDDFNKTPHYSPNGSLQGTIEKSWVIMNGERYLIKGNHSYLSTESINEIVAGKIHEEQNHAFVQYCLMHINGKDYDYGCYSKIFTSQKEELVSAWALYTNEKKSNNVSNFEHLLKMCQKFGMNVNEVRAELEYQIMADFIMSGYDRHLNNIAFLRDADTLQFKGLAPIYDSGGAMFAGKNLPLTEKELLDLNTNSFAKKETDLLKMVRDKNCIDLTKLPSVTFLKELYAKDTKMDDKRLNNMMHWYERKIDICRSLQLNKDPFKKQYYNQNNAKKETISRPKFTMLCGLPGCGKTSYANNMLKEDQNTCIISLSEELNWVKSLTGKRDINMAISNVKNSLVKAANDKKNVIYDASNLLPEHRCNILIEVKDVFDTEILVFNPSFETALINCANKRVSITRDKLKSLYNLFQKNLPTKDEGFDKIILIPVQERELTPEANSLIDARLKKNDFSTIDVIHENMSL